MVADWDLHDYDSEAALVADLIERLGSRAAAADVPDRAVSAVSVGKANRTGSD